jgi:hypothetical protein
MFKLEPTFIIRALSYYRGVPCCGERVGHRDGGFNACLTSLLATDLLAVKVKYYTKKRIIYKNFKICHLTILVYSSHCNIGRS